MATKREGGLATQDQPGPSQSRRGRIGDALRDAVALPTTLKELVSEIRRFNQALEDLHLDPTTLQEVLEVAGDLRKMLAGTLGYRIKKPVEHRAPAKVA